MPDEEQEQKPGADKLGEAVKQVGQEVQIEEVDRSQIGQLRPMPEAEQEQASIPDVPYEDTRQAAQHAGLEEVDQFQTEQFRPGDTPPGDREYDTANQPQADFAVSQTEDLTASARESAIHLQQNELGSLGDREALNERSQMNEQEQGSSPSAHRKQKEQEATQEIEQERRKEQDYER